MGGPIVTRVKQIECHAARLGRLLVVVSLLFVFGLSALACENHVDLIVSNHMPFDISVTYTEYSEDGTVVVSNTSAKISAGRVGEVDTGKLDQINSIPKVILSAQDTSGKTVWQRTWTGREFSRLGMDAGWVVTISPETGSGQ